MKVSIVGPGAMGCLFAGRLSNAGVSTTLVDYKPDRIKRLRASGITCETSSGTITSHPEVVSTIPPGQDLVICCVKSFATESIEIPPDCSVLTLQCGLNNIETLCSRVGSSRVLAGVTTEMAELVDEGRVRQTVSGVTHVGAWTSYPTAGTVKLLQAAGFRAEDSQSPGQAVWERVVIGCAVSPISAILGLPNGKLIEIPEVRQLMRDLVVEAVKVAAMEGYRFETSLIEETERYCRDTAGFLTSMARDVIAKKRTEIEALSGEVLHRGQMAGLPTPRTRVVYQLVKGLEMR